MTAVERPTSERTAAAPYAHRGSGTPRGVQSVKFSFYRLSDDARRLPHEERLSLDVALRELLQASAAAMVTRTYSTVGTRADTDFLVWQVNDDLGAIMDWHSELLRSPLAGALERTHSYLSMTMRSVYENPLHPPVESATNRERLRTDGGDIEYHFVYPMAKTRDWYKLAADERQRIMAEHIEVGHKYHSVKINTTYSYGLDDQEFVVAFEGDEPGEFLALVRELRDSESSSYTLFDTPMFTCRRIDASALGEHVGLTAPEA